MTNEWCKNGCYGSCCYSNVQHLQMVLDCRVVAGGGVWGGKKACTFISGLSLCGMAEWNHGEWGNGNHVEWSMESCGMGYGIM